MAIGLVAGTWEKTIIDITSSGTHRNIPGIPQIKPHRERFNRIINGLRFKEFPMSLGSRILPTQT
jgi:hypothetical protein